METRDQIREGYVMALTPEGKVPSRRFQRIRVDDMDPPTAKLVSDLVLLRRRKGDRAAAERIVKPITQLVDRLWGQTDDAQCPTCSRGLAA